MSDTIIKSKNTIKSTNKTGKTGKTDKTDKPTTLDKAISALDDVRESLINAFVKNPKTLHHLLLVGPPGCGKTTTARRIINAFYENKSLIHEPRRLEAGLEHKSLIHEPASPTIPPGSALFLNASDERGLDSIRAKIYPFLQCRPILPNKNAEIPPRFIVLDEAETLTESAQLALRPVFETPAHEICLIFIVNCISGIHPSLRHRFFRLQFMPPSVKTLESRIESIQDSTLQTPKILDAFRWRGDLRHFLLQPQDYNALTHQIYQWLHSPRNETPLIRKSNLDTAEDIISVGFLFKLLDVSTLKELLSITDPALIRVSAQEGLRKRLIQIIGTYRKKLEDLTPF